MPYDCSWRSLRSMLLLLLCVCLHAADTDVPRWVIAGIARVETGVEWRDTGDLSGTWKRGPCYEIGPWQLSRRVLKDMRLWSKRFRIHEDPVLAESVTRAWLLRLYAVTGDWDETAAAWHRGLGKRFTATAINYAERVRSAGEAQ